MKRRNGDIMDLEELIEDLVDRQFKIENNRLVLKKRKYNQKTLTMYLMKNNICDDPVWIVNNYDNIMDNFPQYNPPPSEGSIDNVQWCHNYFRLKGLIFNYNNTVTFKNSPKVFKMDRFLARMKNDAYQDHLKNYDRIIDNEITCFQGDAQELYKEHKNLELAYDKKADKRQIERFVDCMSTNKERNHLHVLVVRHWIWQVKRKMNNLPVKYHMMVNWFGPTNSGKTLSVNRLFSPLKEMAHDANNLNCLKDDRFGSIMQQFPIIMLDELAGADKVTAEELKRAITTTDWTFRIMHSTQHCTAPNMATFVSTSNIPINCMVIDPTSARRFWQVDCKSRDELKKCWPELRQLDYKAMWKSVDERADTPLEEHLQTILDIQDNELKAESFMTMFLKEALKVDKEDERPVVAHQIELRELEKLFRDWKMERRVPSKDNSQWIKSQLEMLGYDIVTKERIKYVIIDTQLGFAGGALMEIE